MSKFYCRDYTGAECSNGCCPIALAEEYPDRDIDAPDGCEGCWYHGGCGRCDTPGYMDITEEECQRQHGAPQTSGADAG